MSQKVIHLEEEFINMKDNIKETCVNDPFQDPSDHRRSTPVIEEKNPAYRRH